jgi:hypothetical protein
MKKSLLAFEREIKELDIKIQSYYENYCKNNLITDRSLISDGIVDIEEYFNSKIKILWVLKEAYDAEAKSDGRIQGDWSLTEIMGNANFLNEVGRSRKTWEPIIYASWGILHNFIKYDDMDYIKDNPEMVSVLRNIGFINIQKIAANSTSNDSSIREAYNKHRSILEEQIEVFEPDIIIGGNTAHLFSDKFNITSKDIQYDEYNYWNKNSVLVIMADHPSKRVSEEAKAENIDTIIRIAESCYNKH